jgi:hypothetical protein
MANAKADYLRTALIDAVLRNTSYTSPATVYTALYTVAPTNSTAGTEVAGGPGLNGYSRQATAFKAQVTPGATSNNGAVTFGPNTTVDWGSVVATAVLDLSAGGHMLYYGTLAAPKSVTVGDSVSFADGALTITET